MNKNTLHPTTNRLTLKRTSMRPLRAAETTVPAGGRSGNLGNCNTDECPTDGCSGRVGICSSSPGC